MQKTNEMTNSFFSKEEREKRERRRKKIHCSLIITPSSTCTASLKRTQ
jgi:hypothetical protein